MTSQYLIDKFIYSLSHDLRAPISSIHGLVRIAEYYPHHSEVHKCLEMIETCSHKMDKMISNLQEYMENCRHRVMPEDIDPNEIIQKAASDFKNQLDTFKIDLIVDTSAGVSWHMDKYVALRILKHLISNSLAFHDPEKKERKITVRVESNERGSILEVSDNGKGIPGDQQANIFEVFFRGTDNSIGLGMGLFLAKGLAEKMGGIITGKSVVDESTSILVSFQGNSFT